MKKAKLTGILELVGLTEHEDREGLITVEGARVCSDDLFVSFLLVMTSPTDLCRLHSFSDRGGRHVSKV